MDRPAGVLPSEGPVVAAPASGAAAPLALYRVAVTAVAAWSIVATTLLVWCLAEGGETAFWAFVRAPGILLTSRAEAAWVLGACGALALFVVAFALSQAVGRGLLRVVRPRPIPWPSRLPKPVVAVRLLGFASSRPDAFTFTLLFPSWRRRWRREEVILVSEALLASLAPEEVEAVVAHELAHVLDYDGRYLTFLRTFARLLRWDPILAAVASRLTRREEFRADDLAVAATGRPRALARALFKAASASTGRSGPLAGLLGPGGAAGRRQALERIRRLIALAESGRFEEEGGA